MAVLYYFDTNDVRKRTSNTKINKAVQKALFACYFAVIGLFQTSLRSGIICPDSNLNYETPSILQSITCY